MRTCREEQATQEPERKPGPLKQRALALLEDRKKLPIWPRLSEIKRSLRDQNVLLLVGETGSGKSTQVPQCLLQEPWCQSKWVAAARSKQGRRKIPVGGCIAVTEPRRVAAISLARRVAAEMGSPVGSSSPASKVGYSVRFDRSTSPSTRIIFLTEGMLLQELLRDPWLRQYSAVVVDEVHERGVNVDLVLGFLHKLLGGGLQGRGGVPLKVVVMSATADVDALHRFFTRENRNIVGEQARTETHTGDGTLDREREQTDDGYSSWSGISEPETRPSKRQKRSQAELADPVGICKVKGRQYPVGVHYLSQAASDLMECTLRKVFEVHYAEAMPGDVLVFLAGQEEIETLERLVEDLATQMPPEIPKVSDGHVVSSNIADHVAAAGPSSFCGFAPESPGPSLSARAQAEHQESGPLHEHRRDLGHRARGQVRHRFRKGQDETVPKSPGP